MQGVRREPVRQAGHPVSAPVVRVLLALLDGRGGGGLDDGLGFDALGSSATDHPPASAGAWIRTPVPRQPPDEQRDLLQVAT